MFAAVGREHGDWTGRAPVERWTSQSGHAHTMGCANVNISFVIRQMPSMSAMLPTHGRSVGLGP